LTDIFQRRGANDSEPAILADNSAQENNNGSNRNQQLMSNLSQIDFSSILPDVSQGIIANGNESNANADQVLADTSQ
jgi:hypothetical protein